MLNVMIEDSRFQDTDSFPICGECEEPFFAAIEIRGGAVYQTVTCSPDARLATDAQRFSMFMDVAPNTIREWRHGIEDALLTDVRRFVAGYELEEPTRPVGGPISDSRLRWSEDFDRAIRSAVVDGSQLFSKRLLFHALAEHLEKDPFYLRFELAELSSN